MRTSSRKTKNAVAIVTTAAGLAASVQLASAQTWNNPTTGNWNTGANWVGGVAPTASATTALTFNATGAQAYTATNNIANPFQFGTLSVNNSGTGVVTINGSAFSAGGATSGAHVVVTNSATGGAAFNNGGSLYSFRVPSGNASITGGTWNLLSTQRQNDLPVGPIDDGFWSLNVGEGAAAANFTMSGGTMNAEQTFIAVANGSNSSATFSNGAVVNLTTGTGRFGINAGNGTINILSGAQVHTRLIEIGRQGNTQTAVLNVDGATTVLDGGQLVMPRVTGTGTMTITNGAHVNLNVVGVSTGNSFIGTGQVPGLPATEPVNPVPNTASVLVTGAGSQFNVVGQQSVGTTGTATLAFNAGATGNSSTMFLASGTTSFGTWSLDGANTAYTINNVAVISGGASVPVVGDALPAGDGTVSVTNGAQLHANRMTFGQNAEGQTNVIISGPGSRIDNAAGAGTASWAMAAGDNTSAATFTVSNGAVAAAPNGAMFYSGGILNTSGGTTVFNLTNATVNVGFNQISNSDGSTGTMNVNAGGVVNCGTSMLMGLAPNTTSGLNQTGAGAVINTPFMSVGFGGADALGDPLAGGNSFANVTGGAQINTTGLGLNVGDSIDTTGILTVSGANTKITSTGTAQLVVGSTANAIGTFNINSGATVQMAGTAFLSADVDTLANVTVNGGTLAMGGNLQLAVNGPDDTGTSFVTATNGGVLTSANTIVGTGGTLTVGTGTSAARHSSTGNVAVDGTIHYNAGTFNATGTLAVAGNVLLSSAARNGAGTPSNKKVLEVGQATLTTSGVVDLDDNDMLIHDTTAGALQKYENFVRTARNNGLWNQPGITSTAAKNAVPKNKNLGVISGANFHAGNGGAGALFNGRTVATTDTLIKFTFNGDTDLNGAVNFDDYSRVDGGFNNGRTGWFNGDFDYSGVVNFDDYSLIDQAFNTQGAVVLATGSGETAGPGMDRQIVSVGVDGKSMIEKDGSLVLRPTHGMDNALTPQGGGVVGGGNLNAVPEPAALSLIGVGMLGALRRRRRHA